jgi:hypothetical protein
MQSTFYLFLQGDYSMANDSSQLPVAADDSFDGTAAAMKALQNRQACWRDPSALRTMFGVCSQQAQPVELKQRNAGPVVKGSQKPSVLAPGI